MLCIQSFILINNSVEKKSFYQLFDNPTNKIEAINILSF